MVLKKWTGANAKDAIDTPVEVKPFRGAVWPVIKPKGMYVCMTSFKLREVVKYSKAETNIIVDSDTAPV